MTVEPRSVRHWMLLKMLSSRRNGVSITEMAQEMGRDKKTIRRDIDFFRLKGVRLFEEEAARGRKFWKLGKVPAEADHSLNFLEAYALYVGRQFLEPFAGTFLWESAQSAFKKIRCSLNDTAIDYLNHFRDTIYCTAAASDYSKKAELIDALMIAIEESRVASLFYQSLKETEPSTRDVHPYGFMYNFRSLYMVAYAPQHRGIHTYKVNRIHEVCLKKETFQRLPDFDIRKYLEGSFGVHSGLGEWFDVRVRFDATVARYVSETRWHPSQRLIPQRDGGLIAEFRLNSTEELRSWVLGFGSHATVLEPDGLRASIRGELLRALESYPDGSRADQCDTARDDSKLVPQGGDRDNTEVKSEVKRNRQHARSKIATASN